MEIVKTTPSNLLDRLLSIDAETVVHWLTEFLRDEIVRQRKMSRVVIGLSGGVDSAVTASLCVRALGKENVHVIAMPYRLSSADSLADAREVAESLCLTMETIEITNMVDGYAGLVNPNPARLGNICSRCRTNILFDQSAALGGLPVGTGNKTERFFGYFTWHGDDAPPVNPLGDLFKTQVWEVARALNLPERVVAKPPSADLIPGQTDEGDFGLSYELADRLLALHLAGYAKADAERLGLPAEKFDWVAKKVASTHWKRHMPTVAMVSDSSINDYYLRPVDYRS